MQLTMPTRQNATSRQANGQILLIAEARLALLWLSRFSIQRSA